jgi:hypothetical protein
VQPIRTEVFPTGTARQQDGAVTWLPSPARPLGEQHLRPSKACVRRLDASGWQVAIHPTSGDAERHTCSTIGDAARIIEVADVSSVHVWSAGARHYVEVSPQALVPLLQGARRPS